MPPPIIVVAGVVGGGAGGGVVGIGFVPPIPGIPVGGGITGGGVVVGMVVIGKPEDVRSELEATHGHRMMAVVIDKALDWKEKTMRAKWLWISWANLAMGVMIALEVIFITFNVLFIIPKFQRLLHDNMIDAAGLEEHGVMWMVSFLAGLKEVGGITRRSCCSRQSRRAGSSSGA